MVVFEPLVISMIESRLVSAKIYPRKEMVVLFIYINSHRNVVGNRFNSFVEKLKFFLLTSL